MSRKARAGLLAAALTIAGLGLFASGGFGGDQTPSPLGASYEIVGVAMKPAPRSERGGATAAGTRTAKVTQLVSAQPIDVAADDEIVAVVRCTKKQGLPLTGGAIAPPSPAEVAIHVLSAFNPNGGNTPARAFYVGVRNFGAGPEQWLATLTCEKGVKLG